MRLSLFKSLLSAIIATVILFIIEFFLKVTALRVILGVPFVLFFPGFALICALIPKRTDMSTTVRIILSFIASILVDAAIGLVLNYISFGITFNSVIISTAIFIVVISLIGMAVQLAIHKDERASLEFNFNFSSPVSGPLNISLIVVMILVVLGAIGAVAYYSIVPKSEKAYSQFYIVNQGGQLYSPADAVAGDNISLTLGIKNDEGAPVNYRIQELINNVDFADINSISLPDGQQWEKSITLPTEPNNRTEIEFLLFKNDEMSPYFESLRVWVDPSNITINPQ